jgi:TatD DNase family protein
MYLHSRSTKGDFPRIVRENRHKFSTGVVHSFTGDLEELRDLLDMGLYIGINGCSLKTEENLEMVKHIPLDRLMLETDCPYCDIRNSHASSKYVKTPIPKVPKEKYKCNTE